MHNADCDSWSSVVNGSSSNIQPGFPVKADKEYVFFSDKIKNYNPENHNFTVDTYQLTTEKDVDLNRVFVIFSEKPLIKPKLNTRGEKQVLTEKDIKAGYAIPKSVPSADFQKWLIQNRSYKNTQIAFKTFDISIKK